MSLTNRVISTVASNVCSFVLAVVNSILLTRLLGPDGRGEFAIVTASSALLVLVLFFGLDFALSYFVAQGRIRHQALAASTLAYAVAGGVLSFLVIFVYDKLIQGEFFLPRSKHNIPFEIMLSVLVASGLGFAAGRSVFLGNRSFHSINIVDMGLALGSVATYAVLYRVSRSWLPGLPHGVVLALYTAMSFLSTATLWTVAFRRLGVRWTWEFIPPLLGWEMVGLGMKAYVANLLQFLNYRFDYWIVGYFTDFRTLGLYSLASSLGQMFWLVPKSAATVLFPVFASGERSDMESQALIGRVAFWAAAGAGAVAAGLSGWLVPLLYGKDFGAASLAFRILLIGSVPYTLSIILASGLAAKGLQSENARASFWGFAATVVFDIVLIPTFGILGAATASSLSYLVTTGYVLWRFSRAFAIPVWRLLMVQRGDERVILNALRKELRS